MSLKTNNKMRYTKFLIVLFIALVDSMTILAEDKNISIVDLPSHARFFLRTEFPSAQILTVLINENEKCYVVHTDDESRFLFDESGEWQQLECPKVGVPSFIIPHKIQTAVKKNCGPHTYVTELKKISRGRIDVELSSGLGLRFDKKFEIIDVRDRSLMVQNQ